MPAKKAHRQQEQRYARNRSVRTATRTSVGKALSSLASGDSEAAEPVVHEAMKRLDIAVRKGILHRNNAARRKSRLSIRLNRLKAAETA